MSVSTVEPGVVGVCGRERARIDRSPVRGGIRCESTGVCRRGFVSRILTHSLTHESHFRSSAAYQVQEYSLNTHARVSLSVKCGELRRACAIHNGLSQLTWQEIPVWDASQREDGLVEDGLVPAVRLTHTFGTQKPKVDALAVNKEKRDSGIPLADTRARCVEGPRRGLRRVVVA